MPPCHLLQEKLTELTTKKQVFESALLTATQEVTPASFAAAKEAEENLERALSSLESLLNPFEQPLKLKEQYEQAKAANSELTGAFAQTIVKEGNRRIYVPLVRLANGMLLNKVEGIQLGTEIVKTGRRGVIIDERMSGATKYIARSAYVADGLTPETKAEWVMVYDEKTGEVAALGINVTLNYDPARFEPAQTGRPAMLHVPTGKDAIDYLIAMYR